MIEKFPKSDQMSDSNYYNLKRRVFDKVKVNENEHLQFHLRKNTVHTTVCDVLERRSVLSKLSQLSWQPSLKKIQRSKPSKDGLENSFVQSMFAIACKCALSLYMSLHRNILLPHMQTYIFIYKDMWSSIHPSNHIIHNIHSYTNLYIFYAQPFSQQSIYAYYI